MIITVAASSSTSSSSLVRTRNSRSYSYMRYLDFKRRDNTCGIFPLPPAHLLFSVFLKGSFIQRKPPGFSLFLRAYFPPREDFYRRPREPEGQKKKSDRNSSAKYCTYIQNEWLTEWLTVCAVASYGVYHSSHIILSNLFSLFSPKFILPSLPSLLISHYRFGIHSFISLISFLALRLRLRLPTVSAFMYVHTWRKLYIQFAIDACPRLDLTKGVLPPPQRRKTIISWVGSVACYKSELLYWGRQEDIGR